MILQQNLQEVGSESPYNNPIFSYLRLDALLAHFLVVLVGSFLSAVLEALPDFFAAFEALNFALFSAAFDLLLCECFTGAM